MHFVPGHILHRRPALDFDQGLNSVVLLLRLRNIPNHNLLVGVSGSQVGVTDGVPGKAEPLARMAAQLVANLFVEYQ